MPDTSHNSIYLDRLSSALVGAVEDGRIGLPRFVRWLERVDGEAVGDELVTDALDICNRVFGSSPTRQHRSGDGVKHQTLQAVWSNGSSALISFAPAGDRSAAGAEIMLLGSSGAMYFDGALGGSPTVEQVGRS
jgi:hypothetical protein